MHIGVPHDQVQVAGQVEPWSHVAIVVEPRYHDLVPALQLPSERSRQHEVQRGHAATKDDFVAIAAEEARRLCSRRIDDRLELPAGRVWSSGIAAGLAVYLGHRFTDLVRGLRATGSIKEDKVALQAGESTASLSEQSLIDVPAGRWPTGTTCGGHECVLPNALRPVRQGTHRVPGGEHDRLGVERLLQLFRQRVAA